MRRMTYLVMALAMVLGLAQCKKEQPLEPQSEGVRITLNVENGGKATDGTRVNVDENHVSFEYGDQILVAYNGKYVGTITHNGTNFTGNITITQSGDQLLYFYFLGNKETGTLTAGTTTSCTVNISDQTSELPVISMGSSTEKYSSTVTSYSASLQNKCSLMKFNVTTPVASKSCVCIDGMNNKVSVNFATPNDSNNGFGYSKSGIGQIIMSGGDGSQTEFTTWAIVLPQEEDLPAAEGKAYINDYEGTRPLIPAFGSNEYIVTNGGVNLNLNTQNGKLTGVFTVDAGKYVHFSKGNLQATTTNKGTNWTWAFAANQWNKIGNATANTNINGNGTVSANGTVDLFGWSTSTTYLGINNSTANNDYRGGFVDWASHADVTAGIGTGWRTLTSAEWRYLFVTRTTTSGKHYCKAQVNGMPGVILLPDDWSTSYHSLTFCDVVDLSFDASNIDKVSLEDWNNHFVPHGAVFLPTTGHRYKENTTNEIEAPNGRLYYWSSTSGSNTSGTNANANQMYIAGNAVTPDTGGGRHYGNAVRLVRDAN